MNPIVDPLPEGASITVAKLLERLVDRAKEHGLMGVVLYKQGPKHIFACCDKSGQICDPRGWHDAETIEDALAALHRSMNREWPAK